MQSSCRTTLWRRRVSGVPCLLVAALVGPPTAKRFAATASRSDSEDPSASSAGEAGPHAEEKRSKPPRPLRTDGALGLRKAAWMRLHPVEKWTVLVDLGRRAPYLLEKPLSDAQTTPTQRQGRRAGATRGEALPPKRLGGSDAQVRFTAASTLSHERLCHALPYAARLHLAVSLLMWVRALRDVQDTLARTRLPFARSSRIGKSILTHVFPTRLQEHWVDWLTSVTARMDDKLNNTAEQIPAPHTWDPETSETVEDPDSESTLVVGGHRPRHGQKLLRHSAMDPSSGIGLARKVQGITARPSEDDERAAKFTAGRHRRLRGREPQRRLSPTDRGTLPDLAATTTLDQGAGGGGGTQREREGWTMLDARRTPPPVNLVPAAVHEEDARYHGNEGRGEGCPFTDDGRTSATPIHISTADPVAAAAPHQATRFLVGSRAERVLLACVEAHAAVFSSLFVEGRAVQLTVDDAAVYAYAQWLLEELIAEKYVSLELVAADNGFGGPSAANLLLPYYPSYAFPTVLALLPPKRPRAVNGDDISFLASSIVQAAPCDVLVPHTPENQPQHGEFLCRLKAEVEKQKAQLARLSNGDSAAFEQQWRVSWVPLGRPRPTAPDADVDKDGRVGEEKVQFTPTGVAKGIGGDNFRSRLLRAFERSLADENPEKRELTQADAGRAFLNHVSDAVANNFYSVQLLHLPHNSSVTRRELRCWVWQRLPDNVRLVGVNASPMTALFFYPHASFLPLKVGNLFRYRAMTRSVVSRHERSFTLDPVRYTLARVAVSANAKWRRVHGAGNSPGLGFEAALSPRDRIRVRQGESAKEGRTDDEAQDALVLERTVDYLANPSKASLLALFTARLFRL